jgi:hypothetical protein
LPILLEAAAPLLILFVCVPLFMVWLRAMHALVVSDAKAIEYSLRVASMVQMRYPDAMKRIDRGESGADLHAQLLDDMRTVEAVHGRTSWMAARIEVKVAMTGFALASVAYRMASIAGLAGPRREALTTMVSSVRYLSGAAGAQAERGV